MQPSNTSPQRKQGMFRPCLRCGLVSFAILLLAITACRRRAQEPPDPTPVEPVAEKEQKGKPIVEPPKPPKVFGNHMDNFTRDAVQKLGGVYGGWEPGARYFQEGGKPADKGTPGFRFGRLPDRGLPKINVPFGLYLAIARVTDADMKAIARQDNLVILDLDATGVGDAGIKELVSLPKLHSLYLTGTGISDDGVKELAAIKTLKALDLKMTRNVTDAGVKELAALKEMRSLNLNGLSITDGALRDLAGLDKMVEFGLSGTKISDDGMKVVAGYKDLTELDLYFTHISDDGVKHIAGLTKLQHLRLNGTLLTDAGMKHLAGLTNLVALNLQATKITHIGLQEIKNCKKLVTLDIHGAQITDDVLRVIRANGMLPAYKDAQGTNHARPNGLDDIVTLDLSSTRVTDAGLKELSDLAGLRELLLGESKVTPAGVAMLQKALPNCKIHR